jgi:hypothetical protein
MLANLVFPARVALVNSCLLFAVRRQSRSVHTAKRGLVQNQVPQRRHPFGLPGQVHTITRLPGSLLPALRVDDSGHHAGTGVVDVPGDVDILRDLLGPQHPVDVGLHGAGRVQDGRVGQGPFVYTDALSESAAQFVVGEQGRAAVGVVDDRDLEIGALGGLGVDQVTGVGDVGDSAGASERGAEPACRARSATVSGSARRSSAHWQVAARPSPGAGSGRSSH